MTGSLGGLEPLRDANITPPLRRIAIRCGASWPFRQAADTIFELTGVKISHEQIRQLCSDEAEKVNAQQAQDYQNVYQQSLVETMERLVDYLSDPPVPKPNRPPTIDESERVYFGIDGTFINAIEKKRLFEAKAAIVFTNDIAVVGRNRRLLLNKQYVGRLESVDVFSEKLFTTAQAMGISNQPELVILSDGAKMDYQARQNSVPKATLILDWWHLKERVWGTVDWLKTLGHSPEEGRHFGAQLIDQLWRGKTLGALQSIVALGKQLGLSLL